ncbi:MAG: response regulator [Phycisphaerales bacterium]|nr:response regulator [Phycisphaerales bacterium]
MGGESRLNLLLTHQERKPLQGQVWHQTLQQLLSPLGVRTFEATSGSQAVDLIERHPIHLAVVDSRLPTISGMNVLQLIQKLQDQPRLAPTVILIAPQQQSQHLLHEALKFNAFSVLSEPVDVNLMLEVMARALKRFHQNQWPA